MPISRHELEAKIVKRCWEDDAFRREFTSDPAAAFVKYLNVPKASVPALVVHDEPVGSWHIVLPAKPANASELSDEDLEQVAGGITPLVSLAVSGITLIVATVGVDMGINKKW